MDKAAAFELILADITDFQEWFQLVSTALLNKSLSISSLKRILKTGYHLEGLFNDKSTVLERVSHMDSADVTDRVLLYYQFFPISQNDLEALFNSDFIGIKAAAGMLQERLQVKLEGKIFCMDPTEETLELAIRVGAPDMLLVALARIHGLDHAKTTHTDLRRLVEVYHQRRNVFVSEGISRLLEVGQDDSLVVAAPIMSKKPLPEITGFSYMVGRMSWRFGTISRRMGYIVCMTMYNSNLNDECWTRIAGRTESWAWVYILTPSHSESLMSKTTQESMDREILFWMSRSSIKSDKDTEAIMLMRCANLPNGERKQLWEEATSRAMLAAVSPRTTAKPLPAILTACLTVTPLQTPTSAQDASIADSVSNKNSSQNVSPTTPQSLEAKNALRCVQEVARTRLRFRKGAFEQTRSLQRLFERHFDKLPCAWKDIKSVLCRQEGVKEVRSQIQGCEIRTEENDSFFEECQRSHTRLTKDYPNMEISFDDTYSIMQQWGFCSPLSKLRTHLRLVSPMSNSDPLPWELVPLTESEVIKNQQQRARFGKLAQSLIKSTQDKVKKMIQPVSKSVKERDVDDDDFVVSDTASLLYDSDAEIDDMAVDTDSDSEEEDASEDETMADATSSPHPVQPDTTTSVEGVDCTTSPKHELWRKVLHYMSDSTLDLYSSEIQVPKKRKMSQLDSGNVSPATDNSDNGNTEKTLWYKESQAMNAPKGLSAQKYIDYAKQHLDMSKPLCKSLVASWEVFLDYFNGQMLASK
jgi:hypothetical protein